MSVLTINNSATRVLMQVYSKALETNWKANCASDWGWRANGDRVKRWRGASRVIAEKGGLLVRHYLPSRGFRTKAVDKWSHMVESTAMMSAGAVRIHSLLIKTTGSFMLWHIWLTAYVPPNFPLMDITLCVPHFAFVAFLFESKCCFCASSM